MRSPWIVSAITAICFAVPASAQPSDQKTRHEIEQLVANYAANFINKTLPELRGFTQGRACWCRKPQRPLRPDPKK